MLGRLIFIEWDSFILRVKDDPVFFPSYLLGLSENDRFIWNNLLC